MVDGRLTPREMDTLIWLCRGKRNKEIAQIMGGSFYSARDRIKKVYRKLGVHSRLEAFREAVNRGWFDPASR